MKTKFLNNRKLVQYLKKGNEIAYSYLVELYYEKLCDYASNLARDSFRSEDIVQNVFIRMWQQREKLNFNISIKSYLYKSVYNEFVDQYRKDVAMTSLEKKYIKDINSNIKSSDNDKTERLIALVEKEIEQLPPKCKETFLLNKKEGLTYVEIAEFRNVSVGTVEKQMNKAFCLIRNKIKGKMLSFLFLWFKIKPILKA